MNVPSAFSVTSSGVIPTGLVGSDVSYTLKPIPLPYALTWLRPVIVRWPSDVSAPNAGKKMSGATRIANCPRP